jgi:signal transduction histidine kinase
VTPQTAPAPRAPAVRRPRLARAVFVLGVVGLTLLDALLAVWPPQAVIAIAMAGLGVLAVRGRIRPWVLGVVSLAVTALSLLLGPALGSGAPLGLGECFVLLIAVVASSRAADGARGWARTGLVVVAVVGVPLRLASSDALLYAILLTAAAACALAAGAVLRDLDAERRLALEIATRRERDGLARDLHDDFTNRVTGMVLSVQSIRRTLDPAAGPLDAELARVEAAGGEALASMRAWVATLRRADVERDPELSAVPFGEVRALLDRWEAASPGGRADLVDGTPADVADDVRTAAFRIVQEAVTNATRHAADARWIRVALRPDGGHLVVEVASPLAGGDGGGDGDDDHGRADPVPGSPGLGLLGMRERAALVGGTVSAGPIAADGGPVWRVLARLPVGGAS